MGIYKRWSRRMAELDNIEMQAKIKFDAEQVKHCQRERERPERLRPKGHGIADWKEWKRDHGESDAWEDE